MAFVLPTEHETKEERWDRSQNEYKYPWEHREAGERFLDERHPMARRLVGGTPEWEKTNFRTKAKPFREATRRAVTKEFQHQYRKPNADVGHIFSDKNGGSNTLGNVYMQESSFNQSIHEDHDDLNAAIVGYARTEKAMADSRAYGNGFAEGPWGKSTSKEVVDKGKARYKTVGVLTKKGGEVDMRCKAVKRGQVTKDEYGNMHGLKEKCQEIKELENKARVSEKRENGGAVDALSSLLSGFSF